MKNIHFRLKYFPLEQFPLIKVPLITFPLKLFPLDKFPPNQFPFIKFLPINEEILFDKENKICHVLNEKDISYVANGSWDEFFSAKFHSRIDFAVIISSLIASLNLIWMFLVIHPWKKVVKNREFCIDFQSKSHPIKKNQKKEKKNQSIMCTTLTTVSIVPAHF